MKTPLALLGGAAVLGTAALAPSVTTADTVAMSAATRTVLAKDNFFSPKTIRARRGDRIRVVWRGRQLHNVKGPGVNIGFKRRGSASFRARAGTFRCTIHPGMTFRVRT